MAETVHAHPYFPRSILLPHYVPNDTPALQLVSLAALPLLAIAVVSLWLSARKRNRSLPLSGADRITMAWLLISGTIHIILEGYFASTHRTLAGDMSFLGQVWKEYANSDSRYLRSDIFTVYMETVTAVGVGACIARSIYTAIMVIVGPLCYMAAYSIYTRKPYRHLLQLSLSVCQIYGLVLYYLTEMFAAESNSNPYWLYYWVYFFAINFIWMAVPVWVCHRAWYAILNAVMADDVKSVNKHKHQ